MGKKEQLEEGMHEIKRGRAAGRKDRGKNPRLKKKKKMRLSTKIATLCLVLSLIVCAYCVGLAFFRDPSRNFVGLDYGSVSREVENGETYSSDGGYSPVDIFARLNWKFSRQKRWYSEMHGTVDTVIQQEIETYKQYDNGILISADLTKSSLVSGASQFCYVKDQDIVMWRKPVGGASTYNGLQTEWKTGEPYRVMTIGGEDGFKANNGLPAYELSVYVIEENTILEASDVNMTEDGLYKITYSLKPETWQEEENGVLVTKGATAYYANQMIFTGGLPEAPVFDSISVSFTFDKNWCVYKTEIVESYSAKYGPIAAGCVSSSETNYEYDTARAVSSAYEEYFKQYLGASVSGGEQSEKEVTALSCLAEAFGSVLTQPVGLNLDVTLNGAPQRGIVNLDLSALDLSAPDLSKIKAKAQLGAVRLWVQDGTAYLDYGGMKFSLKLEELVSLFGDAISPEEGDSDLLGALAGGDFSYAGNEAVLSSVLPIAGAEIPVKFFFLIDETKTASLDHVETQVDIKEKLSLGAKLSFKDQALNDLQNAEEYVNVLPYAQSLAELFSSDVLHLNAHYQGGGIQAAGDFDIKVKDGFALSGELSLDVEKDGVSVSKTAEILFDGGKIFITLDGIKVKADLEETIALLKGYFELPELSEPSEGTFDLANILSMVLSEEFASRFTSTESENLLVLLVEGTELLRAFGVEFDLGAVRLSVGDNAFSAEALGANLTLTSGEPFDVSTEDYIDVLKYASTVIELIQSEVLHADVAYKTEKLSVEGSIDFNVKEVVANAQLTLTYNGISKEIELIYKENVIYLTLDGLKLSASVEEAVALVEKFVEIPEKDFDSKELINELLSLNFGEVIKLSESEDTLTAAIDGTKLLEALGLTFELGNAQVRIGAEQIDLEVLGANLTLKKGTTFEADTENYIDILKYAETVIELIQSEVLHADVAYKTEKLSVEGAIDFNVKEVVANAQLTLTYNGISKEIELIYKENVIYLTIDGLKLSASVEEAVALVEKFVEIPEKDFDSKELINELLSLNFGEVIKLSESEDSLTAAIDGTKLLEALGLTFELGNAQVRIGAEQIDLEVLGANLTLKKGTTFEVNTENYIDVLKYAETVIELIQSEVLHADVAYKTEKLSVEGSIDFNVKDVVAKAHLTLTYNDISKEIELIYKENVIYLTLDGLKLSASVEEAVALVEKFVEIPEKDFDSKELINELLSLNFGEVIKLSESEDSLTAVIDGTKLLEALGLTFELGNAQVRIGAEQIDLEVLGANLTLTSGEPFDVSAENYIDVLKYASTVIELIQSEVLHADVAYKTEKLSVEGSIDFNVKEVVANAQLTLTYNGISKEIELIYKENVIYLTLDGLKLSASVEEAVALVEKFVEIPEKDFDSKELINELLSLNFGEVIKFSESEDRLTAAIDGTKLLEALGLTFELGNAQVRIGAEQIDLEVLGANLTLTSGEPFDVSTEDYIDVLKYASTVIELIQSEVLHADVAYKTDKLEIVGAIDFNVKEVVAKAHLTLTYNGISKEIELIYKENVIYLTLDGLKLSASVEEAVALVEKFVEIPDTDFDSKELINELLSLNFGEVIKLSESEDRLTAAIDGTKLLEALGLTFELGEANVRIGAEQIDLEVLGAKVTLTSGEPFDVSTEDYIDVLKYASTVIELIQSEVLHADVAYKTEKLSVEGSIDFNVKEVVANAQLTLTYNGISKEIELIYKENVIYLTLDGLKLSASVEEAVALVEKFVEIPEKDFDSKELINELLSLNFGEVIKFSESEDRLTAAIDGTKLLEALGLTFELGNAQVRIGAEQIDLEVLGASLTLKKGTTFEVNTENYIDVLKYASTVIELIQSEVLHADVAYKTEKLFVEGSIDFHVKEVVANAQLTLTYNGISKEIELIYKDNVIYLTLDGLKLSASVEEAVALVEKFVEIPEKDFDSKELINELLSLNFGEVIKLSESEDSLTAAIDGTKLLEALGLTFELGEAQVRIGAEQIDLEVLGANLTLKKGTAFEADTENYIDIAPVLEKIGKIVQNCGLEFRGIFTLQTKEGEIVLEVRHGVISWADGFKLYLDATISVAGTAHDISLYLEEEKVQIVYGNVGAEIVFDEIKGLEEKFLQVYERIANVVNASFKTESGALLPKASSFKELLTSLLGKVEDTTTSLKNESLKQLFEALRSSGSFLGALDSVKNEPLEKFDLSSILGSLVLRSVLEEGAAGRITAEYKGLKLGISTSFAEIDEALPSMIKASISYAGEEISLKETMLYLCEFTAFPEMPKVQYLTYEDYCELLDFFGAAVTTLAEENVGLDLSGKVLSADEKYSAYGGEKYTFEANVRFYSGKVEEQESFPFTIDTKEKSISVRSDMYLKVHLTLSSEVETGLLLDLIVMDMDPSGKTDGKLDFFVSISKYEEGNENRSPLSFYAPASEVKTLLSAACILLGVDNSILNDYLIEKGLSLETRSQLQSIGDSLQLASLLSGLVGKSDNPAELAEILEEAEQEENLKRNYLSKFSFAPIRGENGEINANALTIALNGKAIYNKIDAKDIELVMEKQGESFVSSRLTKIALSGVTSGSGTFSFDLGFSYDEIKAEGKTKIEITHNFDGVERLITSIAKSATHTATQDEIISGEAKEHDYVLNKTFYIDGTAKVSALSLVEAEIKVIAISVTIDEENKVAVNLRLEYDGKHVLATLINGHSIVDITIKGGMVFMKRTQTNYYDFHLFGDDWTDYGTPITIYRTTTLDNFFGDILQHLGFLLNFGDSIVSAIENSEPAAPTDTTNFDYGALVEQYFVGYECKHQEGGEDTWTVKLNGNALTNGVLGEIGITFTADKFDVVKDLHVSTSLYKVINLTLDLNWQNPQSANDYKDNQTDREFADELASEQNGIGKTLKLHDFASERYIEYQKGAINYSYREYYGNGTKSLGASTVYYKMSDRTLLNEPNVPDLEEYNNEEFYLEWNDARYHMGDKLPSESVAVTATQKAHMYTVTFVTSGKQAGTLLSGYAWTQDGENKFFTAQMKYNSTIQLTANGHAETKQIYGDTIIELPDAGQFNSGAEGEWNLDSVSVEEAKLSAFYPLTVRYYSEIGYNASAYHSAYANYDVKVDNSDYKLITPTASGYTFLGWFTEEGGDWREAKEISSSTVIEGKLMLKVEALWASNFSVQITASRSSDWFKYTHTIKGTISGGTLVGAFAKKATISTEYRFYVDNDKNYTEGKKDAGQTFNSYTQSCTNSSIKNSVFDTAPCAHVVAILTYRCGNITISNTAHAVHNYR